MSQTLSPSSFTYCPAPARRWTITRDSFGQSRSCPLPCAMHIKNTNWCWPIGLHKTRVISCCSPANTNNILLFTYKKNLTFIQLFIFCWSTTHHIFLPLLHMHQFLPTRTPNQNESCAALHFLLECRPLCTTIRLRCFCGAEISDQNHGSSPSLKPHSLSQTPNHP